MLFFFTVSNNRNLRIESERKSSDFTQKVKIIDMRAYIIPIVSAVVLLSSCSVYRDGQTPDDVYYSPAPRVQQGGAAYADADGGRNEGRRYNNRDSYNGYDDYATMDDRWLMMRVRNRSRWSLFDDFNYYSPYSSWGWGGFYPGVGMGAGMGFYNGFYDPYGFSYYNHFNNYWNWNSFYNPYYSNIVVINPKTNPVGYNRLRNFNLTRYNNTSYENRGSVIRPTGDFRSRYNNANSNNRLGRTSRDVYSNSNLDSRPRTNYNDRSNDRPGRTYTPSNNNNNSYRPSSGGNSGSNSGSSGGGGGSRPTRR